jgi:hypothetical protein
MKLYASQSMGATGVGMSGIALAQRYSDAWNAHDDGAQRAPSGKSNSRPPRHHW